VTHQPSFARYAARSWKAAWVVVLGLAACIVGAAPGIAAGSGAGLAAQPVQYYGGGDSWVNCASEQGFCQVPYPTVVRFGTEGRYAMLQVTGGVQCSNQVFGDPSPGNPKHCDFMAAGFAPGRPVSSPQYCAAEGDFCRFRGTARVLYGVGSQVTSGIFTNGTACDNGVFGDPAPRQRKACYILQP
jgi:hypothetical protein